MTAETGTFTPTDEDVERANAALPGGVRRVLATIGPIVERERRAATEAEVDRFAAELAELRAENERLREEMRTSRIPRLEKIAREANAECIKHWNRADKAEAERDEALGSVERERRAAKAEALRDAADDMNGEYGTALPLTVRWLRRRADEIERGE